MLPREALTTLQNWAKESGVPKCLMLRGARQVGKTFLAEQLGRESFDSFIEVNFLKQPSLKSVFSGDLDTETLIRNFQLLLPEAKFAEGKTLLLLDEIQECPEAVTSLKFWAQDRRFKVLATGSMLGIDYKRPASYPVGSVEVKAGKSRSKSLDTALMKEEIPYGYKLTAGNVGQEGKKITLPLYMAMFL